jgi:hypothetical protein
MELATPSGVGAWSAPSPTSRSNPALVDELCDLVRRAPSAGNAQAGRPLVLDAPEAVAATGTPRCLPRRQGFRWPGLVGHRSSCRGRLARTRTSSATQSPTRRDRAGGGPRGLARAVLVGRRRRRGGAPPPGRTDAGLGACLFGQFDHEAAVAAALGRARPACDWWPRSLSAGPRPTNRVARRSAAAPARRGDPPLAGVIV